MWFKSRGSFHTSFCSRGISSKIFFQYFKCLKSKKMFNSEQKNTVTAPPEYQNTEIRINNSLSINLPSFSQSIVKEFCQKKMSGNSEKCLSSFPRACDNVFKCLIKSLFLLKKPLRLLFSYENSWSTNRCSFKMIINVIM